MKFQKDGAKPNPRMRAMTRRESAEHQLSLACKSHDWPQAKLWLKELVALSDAEEKERSERAIARFVEVWERDDASYDA